MSRRPADLSFWLQTADDDLTPRPGQPGDLEVDVAIVGAGYSGLWTAREILVRDPGCRVAVFESHIAGFGASGRNGAWLSAGIAVSPAEMARRHGPAAVRRVTAAMRETVDEVIRVATDEGIDAQARRAGLLRVARGRHERAALDATMATHRALGIDDGVRVLEPDELATRIRIDDAQGALFDPHAAAVHPGRLVRGLAHAVERRGATIYEGTPVHRLRPRRGSSSAWLETDAGRVHADTIVLATEAYTSQLPGRRRSVLPLYSLIVLTEPLDDDVWDAIGWDGHELLSSHRYTVDYLSRTVDGRVLFGGRGAPYHLGSRIADRYDRHEPTHALLREQLASWFPGLRDVGFSHAWGGPLGMPRDWLPSFHHDPRTGIAQTLGYTGQGVATSNLGGRVLADLIVHGETPHRDLPMVGHRSRRWEPEPLRWLGARYLQTALRRIDARAARTGRPPSGRGLAQRLIRH
jgi:glycine/D-amino acid oxidase-like deaminating enzyme